MIALAVMLALADTGSVHTQVHYGSATSLFPHASLRVVRGEVAAVIAETDLRLGESLMLALRAPVVWSLVRLPAGAALESTSFGNPELALTRRWSAPWSGDIEGTIALALPLGDGSADPRDDLLANRALALADALSGHVRPGLFAPGAWTASPGIRAWWRGTRVEAWTSAVVYLASTFGRAGRSEEHQARPIGLSSRLSVGASARLVWRLHATGEISGNLQPLPHLRPRTHDGRSAGLTVAPALALAFGPALSLGVGAVAHLNDGLTTNALALTANVAARF